MPTSPVPLRSRGWVHSGSEVAPQGPGPRPGAECRGRRAKGQRRPQSLCSGCRKMRPGNRLRTQAAQIQAATLGRKKALGAPPPRHNVSSRPEELRAGPGLGPGAAVAVAGPGAPWRPSPGEMPTLFPPQPRPHSPEGAWLRGARRGFPSRRGGCFGRTRAGGAKYPPR